MDSIWSYDRFNVNTVENNMDITLSLEAPNSGPRYTWNWQAITPNDIIPSSPYVNAIDSFDEHPLVPGSRPRMCPNSDLLNLLVRQLNQIPVDPILAYDQPNLNRVQNNMDSALLFGLPYSGQINGRNRQTINPNGIIPPRTNVIAIGSFDQLSRVVQHGLGSVRRAQQLLALLPRGYQNRYPTGFNVAMQNAGVGQALNGTSYVLQGGGQRPGVHHGWGSVQQHQCHVCLMHRQMDPSGHFHLYPTRNDISGFAGARPCEIGASPLGTVAGVLANATPEERRTMLGELLYPQVEELVPDVAAKVTGMLLEMDHTEILILLESADSLRSKVVEALDVLKAVDQEQKDNLANQLALASLNDQD